MWRDRHSLNVAAREQSYKGSTHGNCDDCFTILFDKLHGFVCHRSVVVYMPACKCGSRCPFECVACSTQSALLQWVINNSWQWQPDGCVIWSAFFCVGSRKPACMHQFSVGDSCVARIYICTIQKHVNYTWKQMKINENPWTSMKINENNENLWKSMNVNENQW